VSYPLVPKSTKNLRPGQFWAVPLRDGRYGCGRVLQVGGTEIPTPTRAFFGGLHDWISSTLPTAASVLGSQFTAFGVMHVRAITETSGAVLGERPLDADLIQLPLLLSAMGGHGTKVLLGASYLRDASAHDWGTLPVLGYWGTDFISSLAETRLAGIVT
jgi:hypothetical protein